jgi:uroporphyrinogen decarboxylase
VTTLSPEHPLASGRTASSPLVRAYQGERQEVTPVWFMRQAGRSLPEYRELRVGTHMLDACLDPAMASEITLQPVRRHGVDAGIFFSDIVVPLKLAGVDVEIVPGKGPVFAQPVRTAEDVDRLTAVDPASLGEGVFAPIQEAVRLTIAELDRTPLIGFAGAPFTLASYLVEGGPSKDHARTKAFMYGNPQLWHDLLGRLAVISRTFLQVQLDAGASAVQLFDSWAGALTPGDYAASVAPYSASVLARVGELGVPRIHFGVGTGSLLGAMGDAGADCVGVDWRTPLAAAVPLVGGRSVQGNLDPTLVFAPTEVMTARAAEVIEAGRGARGHVFNLGHGVLPSTDPDQLKRLTEFVQGYEP